MRTQYIISVAAAIAAAVAFIRIPVVRAEVATDQEGLKDKACSFIGCPDGPQACADVEGEVDIPGVGHVTVTYHCYEDV